LLPAFQVAFLRHFRAAIASSQKSQQDQRENGIPSLHKILLIQQQTVQSLAVDFSLSFRKERWTQRLTGLQERPNELREL